MSSSSSLSSSIMFQPSLPPALRESALKRLSLVMACIAAALMITEALFRVQVYLGVAPPQQLPSWTRLGMLVPTLACWHQLSRDQASPAFRLGFARIWLWCVTLAMSFLEWAGGTSSSPLGISRVCLVVTLAPVLIPDSLLSNFTYSSALLMTLPLGYLLAQLAGHPVMSNVELLEYLSSNLVAVAAAWVSAASVHQLREQLAGQFGSYRLVRKISAGGYGEVWEAAHRHLRRPAAVKLIKSELGDDVTTERFLREAATLSSLECGHTVRLFDYGVSEDGTLYLAMEMLHGLNCEDLVAKFGPQPGARVVGLLSQACLSLEEAHEKGLIHRDIKPANLFVSRVGLEPDYLKVLDFGLVKSANEAGSNLTQAEQVIGTPDCMSPEQIASKTLDGRSDLYSLGCVGYVLLTGTPVFPAESSMGAILGHISMKPERPADRLGQPVEARLEALILECLAKDPEQRPPTARALYERLAELPQWGRSEALAWWDANG